MVSSNQSFSLKGKEMDNQQSVSNQTQVSITLANHLLSKKFPNSNIVFSPLSIHVVLNLMAAASNGQTLGQLLSFLKTKNIDDLNALSSHLVSLIMADGSPIGGPRLSFANALWVDQTLSLKHDFKHVVDNVYKASSKQVDFQNKADEVVKEFNSWAEKHTNGFIKDVISRDTVDHLTRLIFANAIYFKGVWNETFDRSKTKDHDFHLLDGSKVQVPFMTTNTKQLVTSYDGFKVLGLPYLQGEDKQRCFTMYFFLPDAKDGLPSMIQKMGSESDFLERHFPYQKVKIGQFLIPKFKISFGFKACDMLKELGLVFPFTAKEGLTEMVDGENVCVSGILHKSFLEVNEEGTEAAAVSIAVMRKTCLRIDVKVDFVADHPFLFAIREDKSGVVLFMGQVVDPHVA